MDIYKNLNYVYKTEKNMVAKVLYCLFTLKNENLNN